MHLTYIVKFPSVLLRIVIRTNYRTITGHRYINALNIFLEFDPKRFDILNCWYAINLTKFVSSYWSCYISAYFIKKLIYNHGQSVRNTVRIALFSMKTEGLF